MFKVGHPVVNAVLTKVDNDQQQPTAPVGTKDLNVPSSVCKEDCRALFCYNLRMNPGAA